MYSRQAGASASSRGVEDKCGDDIDEINPIEALWIVWLAAMPDISCQLSGRTLFKPNMIYEFFREHGFSGYLEKLQLRTWEEVVYFIDDREDYYRHKYPCGLDRRNKNIN